MRRKSTLRMLVHNSGGGASMRPARDAQENYAYTDSRPTVISFNEACA